MDNYEKEKNKWYRQIYDKPTLWYQLPDEYIDLSDENFWKMLNFVIKHLRLDYSETLKMINAPRYISQIPIKYRTYEICLIAIIENPSTSLKYIPDEIKTEEMCNLAFKSNPKSNFKYIPDKFKTMEMCEEAIQANHKNYRFIPEKIKTLEITTYIPKKHHK